MPIRGSRARRTSTHRRRPAAFKSMKADDFWGLLRRARSAGRQKSDDAILAALMHELSCMEEPALAAFDEWFRREIVALDTPEFRDVANQLWVFHPEAWFNFRAWCVSRGEEFVLHLH